MAKSDLPMMPRPSEDEQRRSTNITAGPRTQAGGPRPFMTSFLEHLVRNRIISEEVAMQAADWKKQNEKDKRSLIDILKEEFGLSQDVLHYQVAQFYAFRVIDINDRGPRRLLPSDVLKIIRGLPEQVRQLAMRHKVLPYDLAENQPDKIIVVTPNPADREISDVARALPYKKFEICYMKERDWAEYWRQLTLEKDQPGSTSLAASDLAVEESESDFEEILDKDISRGQLQALIENILADAVRVGATDIHVIPKGARKTDVWFRIDGQLALWYTIEDTRTEAVAAVIKSRGPSMDRFERMAAQGGSFQKSIDSQTVRFGVSILPVLSREVSGKLESIAIHVRRDVDPVPLDTAIPEPVTLRTVREAIARPSGLILVAGPSGAGRIDTVASMLKIVMRQGYSTVTVENPMEFVIEGAQQIRLNPKLEYDDAVRAVINHDPDVIYLGELESPLAARTGLRLAMTGRHVFGKIHARDGVATVAHLMAMGIEPFLIAEGLAVVVTQRQVRRLCERCKEPINKVSRDLVLRLGFTEEEAAATTFYRPVGCINCTGGFKGRLPLHEALDFTPEVREIVLWSHDRLDAKDLKEKAIEQGMVTLTRAGTELLKRGLTTLTEVAAALA